MNANNGRASDFNGTPRTGKKSALYLIMVAGALAPGKVAAMSGRGAVATLEFGLLGILAAQIVLFAVALLYERLVFFTLLLYIPFSMKLPGVYGFAAIIMRVQAYQEEQMQEACGPG